MSHIAKNFKKYLLDYIGGIGSVVQEPQGEIIDGLLEAGQQRLVGSFGAFLQRLDQLEVIASRAWFGRPFRIQIQDRACHDAT
jgi:hypothetical protein